MWKIINRNCLTLNQLWSKVYLYDQWDIIHLFKQLVDGPMTKLSVDMYTIVMNSMTFFFVKRLKITLKIFIHLLSRLLRSFLERNCGDNSIVLSQFWVNINQIFVLMPRVLCSVVFFSFFLMKAIIWKRNRDGYFWNLDNKILQIKRNTRHFIFIQIQGEPHHRYMGEPHHRYRVNITDCTMKYL